MTQHQETLYRAVQTRPRPEDVAELILRVHPSLTEVERRWLQGAARYSYRQLATQYTYYAEMSSMPDDFARPITKVARQITAAKALFGLGTGVAEPIDYLDGHSVLDFVRAVGPTVWKVVGLNDPRTDRIPTKAGRRAAGIYKNARWFNKRWRLLRTIEIKIARLAWAQRKYEATRVGKSALAYQITEAELMEDLNTACFIAYMSSRMSLRSVFTNTKQERGYDGIAEILLKRCEASETTRWDLVAMVLPDAKIMAHLDEQARGKLLGQWWELLTGLATMLDTLWAAVPGVDPQKMIVKRGQDSTTWNQVAAAWNKAREHWISALYAMGQEALLDTICPGKVMRLMAADVARWHQATGGDVHPDTKVWATLPEPWKVLRGEVTCTRGDIETACDMAGAKVGNWVAPRGDRVAVEFRPTPELVHGVAVSSPALATLLRKAGYFSGKPGTEPVPGVVVDRDPTGAALLARKDLGWHPEDVYDEAGTERYDDEEQE